MNEGSKGGRACAASEVIALAATANDDDGPLWPTPQTAEETWTTMIRGMRCPVRSFVRLFVHSVAWLWSALRGKARLALQHDVVFLFFPLLSFPSVAPSGVVLGREMKTLEMRNAIRR